MRKQVTVLNGDSECAQTLAERDYTDVVVDDYVEMSGSDVVIADDGCDWEQVWVRAPNSTVLVCGDRDSASRALLFPDERVIAVDASTRGAALAELVEHVLFERQMRGGARG
jgi:hypothetical protein